MRVRTVRLGVWRLRSTEATSLALSMSQLPTVRWSFIGLRYTLLPFMCNTRQQSTLKLATSSKIEKTKNSIGVADISSILQALYARNNSILPKSWNISYCLSCKQLRLCKSPSFYWDSRDVLNEEHFKFPVALCHERAGHVMCHTSRHTGQGLHGGHWSQIESQHNQWWMKAGIMPLLSNK